MLWAKSSGERLRYVESSKFFNTFHFLFSNKMFVTRAEIHKMLVKIANREDPDQTASSEAVSSRSALFVYAFLARS